MTGKKDRGKSKNELITDLAELRLRLASLERAEGAIKQAELAARAVSEYAENIVETVREPLLVLDSDLKVLSANQSFYDTFKVTPKESIGTLVYDLGNSQWDIPSLRTLLQDILPKDRKFANFEVDHVFSSIGHKVMLLNARRIQKEDIGSEQILLAIEDITERKRVENELKDSEERFRRVFETAKDGLLLIDKQNGNIVNVNSAMIKLLGYSSGEFIGKKLQDVGILKDIKDFKETIQEVIEYGFTNYDDVAVETKAGDYVDAEIYFVDRTRFIQCNVRDITKRKRKELNRLLFNKTPIGIFNYDTQLIITECNDRFMEILQSSREKLLGLDMKTLQSQNVIPAIRTAIEGEEGHFEGFYRATTGTAEIWISCAPPLSLTRTVKSKVA